VLDRLKSWLARAGFCSRDMARPAPPAVNDVRTPLELALSARPGDANLNFRMGHVLLAEGDAAGALDYFHLALHYAPGLFPACAARVRALLALGRQAEEADAYREFLRANPGHPGAAYALAVWHHARGEHESAIELLRPLVDRRPPDRDACNLLGLILGREFGQFDEGERLLRLALEPEPLWPVALSNLGWILLEKGDYVQGLKLVDAALERDPDDHETRLVRSYMNLKRGEFEQGWRDYEARHQSRFAMNRPYDYAQWDGTPVSGKTLLVYAEQGFGDQIMFASCFHEAIRLAGRCIIECDPRLVALFRRSFPAAVVEASAGPGERAAWTERAEAVDCQIPMGSLPGFFRKHREEFPRHAGYLRAAPERVAYWRARLDALGDGPKIGLSWRGGIAATRRHLRSLALEEFLPLLQLPARFVSLQYGDCCDDLESLRRYHGVVLPHWQDAIDEYDETAALVCALDLVVSVCTAVIHLTGALGRPVWVMVPAVAEWRYLDRGETLPWYPSARLFRQTEPGRWEEVIGRVSEEIEQLAATISRDSK
jgi:tetratricopeptide (TPR) repeat protein